MSQHRQQQTTKNKGDIAESSAASYLKDNGFTIIERNFYAKKLGEIDIIASKDSTYHFIEVKSGDTFEAVYNITPAKLSKLYRSIQYYLKLKNLDVAYCVDAIIVSNNNIEYLENISL